MGIQTGNLGTVSEVHPQWLLQWPSWNLCYVCYQGKDAIIAQGEDILPRADWMTDAQYAKAQKLGVFHYETKQAVERYKGILQQEPPEIKLTPDLEPLRDNATKKGKSYVELITEVYEEQLLFGRCFVLVTFAEGRDVRDNDLPYFRLFNTFEVLNWGTNVYGDFIVLLDKFNDTSPDNPIKIEQKYRTRILQMFPIIDANGLPSQVYTSAIFNPDERVPTGAEYVERFRPVTYNGITINRIPGTFFNSQDNSCDISEPPLIDVAQGDVDLYIAEVSRRMNSSYQDKHILITSEKTESGISRLQRSSGSSLADINQNTSDEEVKQIISNIKNKQKLSPVSGKHFKSPGGGEGYFISPKHEGFVSQGEMIRDDRSRLSDSSGDVISSLVGSNETAETARLKVEQAFAKIRPIQYTIDFGFTDLSKVIAYWRRPLSLYPSREIQVEGDGTDANPGVSITTNKDFIIETMTAVEFKTWGEAAQLEIPVSDQVMNDLMRAKGVTKFSLSEIYDQIESELDRKIVIARKQAELNRILEPNNTENSRNSQNSNSDNSANRRNTERNQSQRDTPMN